MSTDTTTDPAVKDRATAAYWYAAGRADGAGTHDQSWGFRNYHAAQAHTYYVEQSATFLPSIPDAYSEFLAR